MAEPSLQAALRAYREGRLSEVVRLCADVLATEPDDPGALHLLGCAQLAQSDTAGAARSVERAIRARPAFAEAHNTLGSVHRMQGALDDARRMFEKAVSLRPDFAEAHLNLGLLLGGRGAFAAAEAAYRRCIELAPQSAKAHRSLAAALLGQDRLDEAEAAARHAQTLEPDDPAVPAVFALIAERRGAALLDARRHREAIRALRQSLSLAPGRFEPVALLLRAHLEACDWAGAAPLRRALLAESARRLGTGEPPVVTPFVVTWSTDADLHRDVAVQWSRGIADGVSPRTHRPRPRPARLRLGYLSADFRNHATAHLIGGLFGHHDRERFAVNAYAYGPEDDSGYRRRLADDADRLVDVGDMTDEEAAERIADDGIDVLVDLKGHTAGARLGICAYRPAPIQVTWLGYPGTTGAPFLDYLIGDDVVSPPEEAARFTEQLALLPDSYQINDDRQPIAREPAARRDVGLPEGAFVFCCFNQSYKIDAPVWARWMRLLEALPGSVLWLYRANPLAEENLRRAAKEAGVSPPRLHFAEWMEKPAHLARLRLADLCLDTQPCSGHTTTSDALWAGLPVVTVRGAHFAGRVGASLLRAAGLEDLVAADLDAYQDLALGLAREPAALASVRDSLAGALPRAPLFDTQRTVRALEDLFDAMWARHEEGLAPAPVRR